MDFEWWRRPRVSRDRQMELAIVLHLPLSHGVSLNVYYLQYKAGTVPVASRTPERTVQPNFHHLFHFRVDTTLAKTYHILSKHLCIDHNLTNHNRQSHASIESCIGTSNDAKPKRIAFAALIACSRTLPTRTKSCVIGESILQWTADISEYL